MNHYSKPFHLRPIAIIFALAFPLTAKASTVEISLASNGTNSTGIVTSYVAPTSDATNAIAKYIASDTDSISTGTAAADGTGHFGASSQLLHGKYDPNNLTGTVHLEFKDSIINSTATTQAASFNMAINALSFQLKTGSMGDIKASFSAKVYVNDAATPIWESSASLSSYVNYTCSNCGGANAPVLTQSGPLSLIDGSVGSNYSYFLPTSYATTLSLGDITPGGVASVRYVVDINTMAYAYGGLVTVNFDDPSKIALNDGTATLPATAQLSFAQAVPEPETYAMMAAGLGLVAAAARRRRQRA